MRNLHQALEPSSTYIVARVRFVVLYQKIKGSILLKNTSIFLLRLSTNSGEVDQDYLNTR